LNKTEGPKVLLIKKQGFKITLNKELNNKLIQKNSLPSTAHESQFRDKNFTGYQNKDTQLVPKSWATDRLNCGYKE
jgi:hypothetical protein